MKCYNELLSLALDPFNNLKEQTFKKNYNVNSSNGIKILLQKEINNYSGCMNGIENLHLACETRVATF